MNPVIATLTPTEKAIVRVLEEHRYETVSVLQLIREAYGYASVGYNPGVLIRAHMTNIRAKGVHVRTFRRHGYAITTENPFCAPIVRQWHPLPLRLPAGFGECHCGATYRKRTGKNQWDPWAGCQAHRGQRYDEAKARLTAWRAANHRATGVGL